MHGLVALGSSLVRQLLENMSKILKDISFWLPFQKTYPATIVRSCKV